ncbi:hypothetical protein FAZ69_06775 [Trinickia terrae]|uniref:PAAR domain-containing protein n=1 Tax=Trinickia terrae TaxID=2571161 RepID=A0A4U1IBW2_9BURK|nr:hypothetical protein [Trinickia terrae]TKC91066.1 hypothetical protein FAZ69_06775 [Trinickia terrae]
MTIYYAAVDGDPLTGNDGSYVIAKPRNRTIADESGKLREGALIGDFAFCATCGATGEIAYGVILAPGRRPKHRGVDWALGGDIVLCKCATPPSIYPVHGKRCKIFDSPPETRSPLGRASTNSLAALNATHWIGFTLSESASYEGMSCVAHFTDGSSERGVIDARNNVRFTRANDSACKRIEIVANYSSTDGTAVSEALLSAIAQ